MENLGNNKVTQLASNCLIDDLAITVLNSTDWPDADFRVLVGNEYMLVTSKGSGSELTWTVTREIEGTTKAAYAAGTPVYQVMTAGGIEQFVGDRQYKPSLPNDLMNRDSWSEPAQLFTATDAGVASLYWACVIKTTGRITDALGKYYMYYSTDHDTTLGGIYMSYSDSPKGPFTHYGLVFQDSATYTAGTPQTETPSLIWDDANARFNMYYQNQGAQYAAGNAKGSQSTLMAYTTDGISFTKDNNFILDIPGPSFQIGDGHTGYFRPFLTKKGWHAYSLYGGTNGSACVLWQLRGSMGGQLVGSTYSTGWMSDRAFLGYGCDIAYNYEPAIFGAATVLRTIKWNNSVVVEVDDVEYLIGMIGNVNSGGSAGTGVIAAMPVASDYKGVLSKPSTIWSSSASWESSDLRSVSLFSDGGKLYCYYTMAGTTLGVISYDL